MLCFYFVILRLIHAIADQHKCGCEWMDTCCLMTEPTKIINKKVIFIDYQIVVVKSSICFVYLLLVFISWRKYVLKKLLNLIILKYVSKPVIYIYFSMGLSNIYIKILGCILSKWEKIYVGTIKFLCIYIKSLAGSEN